MQDGFTPLMYAVLDGQLEATKLLIARGANVWRTNAVRNAISESVSSDLAVFC